MFISIIAFASAQLESGRKLRPAEFSREELESIDLFLVLLVRVATFSLAFALALPLVAPFLVGIFMDTAEMVVEEAALQLLT
jgi:hypothetical protein